ncbi:magnesium transporter MgtE N-terminal domain-containing protein, partial [Vibrio vulnificus]|uniref:magnesium transporter MgtE N-terminal domain-containing protein n=1 Tax=Vibrio vulnificus TaxID=672 RepID=UPI003ED905EA
MSEYQDLPLLIEQIAQAEDAEQIVLLNDSIEHGLESGSIALILESQPVDDRVRLWRALPLEMHIDVLTDMRADARYSVINALSEIELKLTLAKLDNLSLIEWADSLPEEIINEALSLIQKDELELFDLANKYGDDELGRWAERKIITLPFNISVDRAKRLMEKYSFDTPQQVYLINKKKQFRGVVNYYEILRSEGHTVLKNLVIDPVILLSSKMALAEAVEHSSLPALPVVDEDQTLIGEVDWQFALTTQREIYEARLMAGTGMDEGDDLFAPVIKSSKKRGVWLNATRLRTSGMFIRISSRLFQYRSGIGFSVSFFWKNKPFPTI